MSEWIESHASLPRHRKLRRLARLLDVGVPEAVGYLHMLWYYALDFAPGGDLAGHSYEDIADGCGWKGDAERFIRALIECGGDRPGWLDESAGELNVHDWEDCNQSHRRRMQDAQRQREKRDRDREKERLSRDVTVTVTPVTPDRQTGQTGQTGQTDALTRLAIEEIPGSKSTVEDYQAVIEKAQKRLGDKTIERTILELANWEPKKPRAKLHLTLAAWLLKCPDEPRPAYHQPLVIDEDRPPGAPMPKEAKDMLATMMGRRIT